MSRTEMEKELDQQRNLLQRLESDIADYAKYYPNLKGIKREIIEDFFTTSAYWASKSLNGGYSFVADNRVSARNREGVPDDTGVLGRRERSIENYSVDVKELWSKSDAEVVEFARQHFTSKISELEDLLEKRK